MEEISFKINGIPYKINATTVPIDTSLNAFIRDYAQLPGTKFMCLEGGCGACIVAIKGLHPVTKDEHIWAVNSCLLPIFSCHQYNVITIEGIGNRKIGYHPLQTRLHELNGSQCGYCSPGMIMNMYSLSEEKSRRLTMDEIENSFGGNICRCTGYRPILDAFKSFAIDVNDELLNATATCTKDIEDLSKVCEKRPGVICNKMCPAMVVSKENLHLKFNNKKEWHKVFDVKGLQNILVNVKKQLYMLVAGNTAHGVYRRNPDIEIFIDITAIEELRSHIIDEDTLNIGGNVTLTELMDILADITVKTIDYEYCNELRKHIDLIANVPVRNTGTIAGNLMIKHTHKAFPSDLFVIFEAIGVKLTIVDVEKEEANNTTIVSCKDFLKLNMNKKIILNILLPKLSKNKFTFRSYKIMPRAQNAHAYVNAAFLIEYNDNNSLIQTIRICYGGITPDFVHAKKTEKLLIGKDLYTNAVLRNALNTLSNEIHPDWILPDASSNYRKNVAIALFYKFILNVCPKEKITPIYLSGGEPMIRELSSGTQTYDTYENKYPLTKPLPKYEGLIQCSGEASYVNDMPKQKNELWAAYVHATKVHYKIGSIDAAAALSIPGVHYFFSAKDVPGSNNYSPIGMAEQAEEIFVGHDSEILFHGQPAGIILADTFALANYAATKVKIIYEKFYPRKDNSLLDIARSLLNPFIGSNNNNNDDSYSEIIPTINDVYKLNATDRFKDLSYGMNALEYGTTIAAKITGRFEIGAQYHYTMETLTTICVPTEDGGLDVFASTQWPDINQVAIAQSLNISENKINMHFRRIGGGYGTKITRTSQVACACALACHLTYQPVRFVLSIESNMMAVGKRYALISDYEVEVDENGVVQKLQNNYAQDYGCTENDSVQGTTDNFFKNCYKHDRWTTKPMAAMTDAPSHTWCRSPGTTEGIAMIENIMEHIAYAIDKDPINIRLANIVNDNPLKKIIPDFLKDINYYERKNLIDTFNKSNRWRKRGIAIVPMQYLLDYYGAIPVFVAIYHADGSVIVTHAGTECGQGINTKVAQVAAYILGIPLKLISIKQCNNIIGANATGTGGSQTSEAVCHAVKKACEIILERMKPVRDKMKNAEWKEITIECHSQLIDLSEKYLYKESQLKAYNIYGTSCAEIEIDILTGNLQLKRVDILEDTGESMNPNVDIGQIEGAFIMGIGYWLTENLIYNRQNGELLTNRTWTYKPPGAKDIPIDFRITLLRKSSNEFGVLRSKATGEPPLCMSIVVLFALRYALHSARNDAGIKEKWFPMGAPSTPESLFLNAGNSIDGFEI